MIGVTNNGPFNRETNPRHQEDPDCGNQTKPKIDKQITQSGDLMETEESKSQANLDPTLKYSEQFKAADPDLSDEAAKGSSLLLVVYLIVYLMV